MGILTRKGRSLLLTFLMGLILSGSLSLFLTNGVLGQTPSPSPTSSISQPRASFNLPGFRDFFPNAPNATVEAIRLDGRKLFDIATAEVGNRSQNANETESASLRASIIEDRLRRIATSNFSPESLQVVSDFDRSSNQPILYVNYRVGEDDRQDELMTVTTLDAQLHGTDPATWAEELIQIIESALLKAKQERQSGFLRQQAIAAAGIIVLILLTSFSLTYLQKQLQQERHRLAEARVTQPPVPAGSSPAATTALIQQRMEERQKSGMNDIKRRFLQIGQLLIWGGGFFAILGLFPYSRWLQPLILNVLQVPFKIGVVGYITYLVIRISEVLIDRLLLVLQSSASLAPEASERIALRFSTFSRVIKSILVVIFIGTGIIVALSVVGVQVAPLLAGAGIIGLAISLASQNLIKDMINGFLILLEDQYGVGDVIVVGDVSGLVENMNLRITQLRNEEGRLITIPNGAISIVQNLSKEWSRVDLRIDVAYSADLNKALEVIEEIADEMSNQYPWKDLILEPPSLLGVDKLDSSGATVRLWIKTEPLKQWQVAREYRRRLKMAFDQLGIAIGIPQQALVFGNPLDIERLTNRKEDDRKDSNPKDEKVDQKKADSNL